MGFDWAIEHFAQFCLGSNNFQYYELSYAKKNIIIWKWIHD